MEFSVKVMLAHAEPCQSDQVNHTLVGSQASCWSSSKAEVFILTFIKAILHGALYFRPLLDGKSEMLSLTAAFWANAILPKIEITDPNKKAPMGRECYDESIITPEPGLTNNSPLVEPTPTVIIEKQAHRLLRIKKKKMKVHRRKRRWKKYWYSCPCFCMTIYNEPFL